MNITRRNLLQTAAAGLASAAVFSGWRTSAAAPVAKRIRIGSCAVGLDDAKLAGLDGVEVRAGNAAERLEIADPAVRRKYKEQMQQTGLPISSLMMGILNLHPLASDPRGPAWLEQCIDGARDLGAKVILVAFFGKGNLLDENKQLKKDDVDAVVKRLKAAAPRAKDAGVTLAIENLLSAQQNAAILDRIGHASVQIYYDAYNLAGQGYDVPAEIRFLRERIVMIHFKNGPDYLDNGKVQYPPVAAAIQEIGYQGWIVLETSSPSKNRVADAQRNAQYVRKLFGLGGG